MTDLTAIGLMRQLRELHDLHHPATQRPPPMRLPPWLMDLLMAECREAWEAGRMAFPCPFGDPDTVFEIRVTRDYEWGRLGG